MRSGRKRNRAPWVGLAACAFVALLMAASGCWSFAWKGNEYKGALTTGTIWVQKLPPQERDGGGLRWSILPFDGGFWRSPWVRWWFDWNGGAWSAPYVMVPLWIPLLALLLLTGARWRSLRAVVQGTCSECGYDLTGNESGRCPECGHAQIVQDAQAEQ